MSILLALLTALATATVGWRSWKRLRYYLHMYQLESYKPVRFISWLMNRGMKGAFRLSHQLALATLITAGILFQFGVTAWTPWVLMPLWSILFASFRQYGKTPMKKPLAFTSRMKRMTVAATFFALLPAVAGGVLGWQDGSNAGFLNLAAGLFLMDLGAPLWVWLGGIALLPLEHTFQAGFKRQARNRLRKLPNLDLIAITGSYGKTSVKFITAEILAQQFRVLATPGSYNTPMGICLVVNTKLKEDHEVLVLEMGMRYRGDINELCAIARPRVAIVTDVGPAHLETMGSLENIALEKGDLVANLPADGVAILNIDNPRVAAMAARAPGKIWRVSVDGIEEADITASNISYGSEGTQFTVHDESGQTAEIHTQLLGRHNVLNILLGIAVGREKGLRLRQMAHAIARIKPVEHRLQLRKNGPVTIIDDAFNANPVGARNAVEVLGAFQTGRRVIVTPGMVELGEKQWEENRQLGAHIAQNADLAILIGEEQTRPIQEGLAQASFPKAQTHIFPSFFDAQQYLDGILTEGDVVLYENDLPDQYAEKG